MTAIQRRRARAMFAPSLRDSRPCTLCHNYDLCATQRLACEEFAQWVELLPPLNKGDRTPSHRTPTADIYNSIFSVNNPNEET